MTRLAVSAALLLSTFATCTAHAQEVPDDDTVSATAEAGVSATDLLGAMNSTGLEARQYLAAVGELAVAPPTPPAAPVIQDCGLPICGALGARLLCIEGYESHHNGTAVNRSSGAAGWLQWLSSTARTWGVQIGNRASEWAAAARIAALGERFLRSQWVPLQRGLC